MNFQCRILVASALACLLGAAAAAKVARVPLASLLRGSGVIAVARVVEVKTEGGVRIARAEVCEPLKGCHRGDTLVFLAEKTWSCDVSTAISGETVVLLLTAAVTGCRKSKVDTFVSVVRERYPGVRAMVVDDAGRGRMPISEAAGQEWVVRPLDVVFPHESAALPLADFMVLVKRTLAKP